MLSYLVPNISDEEGLKFLSTIHLDRILIRLLHLEGAFYGEFLSFYHIYLCWIRLQYFLLVVIGKQSEHRCCLFWTRYGHRFLVTTLRWLRKVGSHLTYLSNIVPNFRMEDRMGDLTKTQLTALIYGFYHSTSRIATFR